MRLAAYLDRIGFEGTARPDLETLGAVHRRHLLGPGARRLVLRDERFARWALGEIGFRIARLSGSVGRAIFGDLYPGNHPVLRIDLEARPGWLTSASATVRSSRSA